MRKKEERMRFLQRYWSDKLRGFKNVIVNTPEDNQRSCGIGNVGLTNMSPSDMAKTLFKKYKIFDFRIKPYFATHSEPYSATEDF